jgi:acyl carrier protein phosphodiesterase
MNYLAHIHLAHLTNTSMLGNFLGDFVKGSDLSHLNDEHQLGVILHRKIDSFTDTHGQVKALRNLFPKSIRRMSGVVIDIYFDHLLCAHWTRFSEPALDNLLEHFYIEIQDYPNNISDRFTHVRHGLLTYRWLADYQHSENCERSFLQIEKRLTNRVIFANEAMQFIQQNESELQARFLDFYPELIEFSDAKAVELRILNER